MSHTGIVTPVLNHTETGALGLADFQPGQENVSPRFKRNLSQKNRQKVLEEEPNVPCWPLHVCTDVPNHMCNTLKTQEHTHKSLKQNYQKS